MKVYVLCAMVLAAAMATSCGQAPPAKEAPAALEPPKPAMPMLPEWAKPLSGKMLSEVSAKTTMECIGYVDGLAQAYADGAQVVGWAWNLKTKSKFTKFFGVDNTGVIRGGGEGGQERPDVSAALADTVGGTDSGFLVTSTVASGSVDVYAYDDANNTLCLVGTTTY